MNWSGIMKLFKEPFHHYLLISEALFGVYAWMNLGGLIFAAGTPLGLVYVSYVIAENDNRIVNFFHEKP